MLPLTNPITCDEFETNVSEFVDGALSAGDRAVMETHMSRCDACTALHSEISAIVAGAASLPLLDPSRDLWSGIADRLDTPVVAIGTSGTHAVAHGVAHQQFVQRKRHLSLRQFAAAAVLIVAASSGATFVLTRANNQPTESAPAVVAPVASAQQSAPVSEPQAATPTAVTPVSTPSAAVASRPSNSSDAERSRTRYATNNGGVDMVYEREITAMRRIVDERLGDLDSVTVAEIERNLNIIDKAIADSRRALEKDPRSRFLSSQLDRALETKLGVLRRIALL